MASSHTTAPARSSSATPVITNARSTHRPLLPGSDLNIVHERIGQFAQVTRSAEQLVIIICVSLVDEMGDVAEQDGDVFVGEFWGYSGG